MRIISLESENFKRLKAIEIRPDGDLVEITGRNGAGKSSTLDAIWAALAGKDAAPVKPVRKGEKEATIALRLGDDGKTALKVTRKFIAQDDGTFSTSLKVENGEGARYTKPQQMLDDLVGALSFDPLEFTRLPADKQLAALAAFVKDVDLAALKESNATDFKARTDINRRAKELRAQAEGVEIPMGAPKQRVDDAELLTRFQNAGEENAQIARRAERRRQMAEEAERKEVEAERMQARAVALRAEADKLAADADALSDESKELAAELADAPALPALVDVSELRQQIDQAKAKNELFDRTARAKAEYQRLSADAKAQEDRSAELTAAMAAREKQRDDAVKAAKMPVKGLDFGDDEILLDGIPFSQASDAQKLRTSIAIAAAMNPTLRVIRVRDGSLLDKDSWALLAGMAEQMDMQCWVETVQSGRDAAIVIEDGEIAAFAEAAE